ncbi:hypothetical protein [Saccharopolyspora cebuensis]|uniref:Nucleoside-diphosphate-sugar epimerase n=1 Tax=Saccharopolyspora cebuensis TaxID=418759 RepID=A0ABV4CBP1_9PSEU
MNHEATTSGTAVLAGCGDLGGRVGVRLAASGYRVLGLRRRPDRIPAPIEGRAVDLGREVPRLPADTGVLVVALTPGERTEQGYRDTFVAGLRNLLDAVDGLPAPPRTLFVSSTAVHGTADGSWIDERTPADPPTATAAVLREAEELLHERLPTASAVRLGGLYGAGRGPLLTSVAERTATLPRTPVFINRIHRDDAAAALAHLSTRATPPAPLYLGVDDEPCERGEVLRFLADELGVEHPPVADDEQPRGQGKRCRNDRLRETGFEFQYPTYREGYRAVLS